MPPYALATGTLVIACLLMLAACGSGGIQARTDGYGNTYTQFGRD
ncbi:MAG: hypothetical protein WDO24_28430 [Pseudomonadota bacterium]